MDKIIAFTVIGSLAAMPLMMPLDGGTAPELSGQQRIHGERAGGAVSDIISAKEFGRENAEWLVRHYGNSTDMTLLCGCAEGWRRVLTTLDPAGSSAQSRPESDRVLGDRLLPRGQDYKERVKYLFRDPAVAKGGWGGDGYRVLDGTLSAGTACSTIGAQGVRLAFDMSVPSAKEGLTRLNGACQGSPPVSELAANEGRGEP